MTKRALKRSVREGEFDAAQFEDDAKIRRLPVANDGWSPLRPGIDRPRTGLPQDHQGQVARPGRR